ncbi:MAG: DUF4440 domain-containing protein [Phycisphaerales bacterium]|nr:DUF4440 domain-containing protein [Phycisphaerales bacterium]
MHSLSIRRVSRTAAALALAGVVSALLTGCAFCGTKSEACSSTSASARAEAARTLASLDDQWSAAAATRDVQRVGAFYADDAVAYPPGEPLTRGRAAAQRVWGNYFADPSFQISWKSDHAEVAASGDLGFTSGPYRATYKGPDGAVVNEQGKFLCVWRKQADGTWKATHDMWNADAR